MFYQTSQVSLPTPASGTRNPEGGYPPDKKKFSVTSRMGPVFISVVSGNLRPIENAGSGGSQEGRNLCSGEIRQGFVLLGRFRHVRAFRLFLKIKTLHGLFFEINLLTEIIFFYTFKKKNAQNGLGDLVNSLFFSFHLSK